ncbi:hypothetical protein [Crassaminicella indica]|uniref:Uncharacterized protein n=1 Tax=Crassaminicella indica TaxID=2855394 RepID=A0ABX8RHB5_9CLOT|nr:hypothetical protein [Crassaminicella indica]QXM07120.1 hypothetical protein KVH43_05290 [Crassaminicella indica]
MKNNRLLICILLCSIFLNIFFTNNLIQKTKDTNRFIKYNFTGILYIIIDTLEDLDNILLSKNELEINKLNKIEKKIEYLKDKIFRTNIALSKYDLLNPKFGTSNITIYEVGRYLKNLEYLLKEKNISLFSEQSKTIRKITNLAKENDVIYFLDYYDDNNLLPRNIVFPKVTETFFRDLNKICKEANDQIETEINKKLSQNIKK